MGLFDNIKENRDERRERRQARQRERREAMIEDALAHQVVPQLRAAVAEGTLTADEAQESLESTRAEMVSAIGEATFLSLIAMLLRAFLAWIDGLS